MRWSSRPGVTRDPDPAASMAVLEEVLDPPVGPGYHSAAEARVSVGLPPSSGSRTWLMLLTALALGFLITVSAVTLRTPDPAAAETRAQLIERIESAEDEGDEQSLRLETLRADILLLEQRQALAAEGPVAEREITESGVLVGAGTVEGPGVVVALADATRAVDAAPGDEADPERVNARDIQLVVNGLWAAGAEVVAVNDQRLTSMSAIRFAGEAIIVDFRTIAPPYEVRAIGDPVRLETEATTGATGAYLRELRQQLGLQTEVSVRENITIGPAERLSTRVGTVPDPEQTEENR
ncbi:DUF881 domain-containing protein [Ornithinimicrobium sp. LYQ103]|uniref:DUF881 domain-containing protein n=1 Tax=Ornithinimicrobium sp. LYQ103 TaxID=3378796 RepID=UPI0038555A9A